MAIKRLSLIRGDSTNYNLTFKKADGTPYCIKNWVVHFTIKTNYDLTDAQASVQKIVTTFDDSSAGTSGSAVVALLPSDTASLDPGEYDFDIAVTTNTSENYTVLRGKLDVEYDVTRLRGTAGTAA